MQNVKKWFTWQIIIITLLGLTACAPTTTSETTSSLTSSTTPSNPTTDVPALNPVTPPPTFTPEKVFAPDPDATKALPTSDQVESSETDSRADTQSNEVVLVYERAGGLKGIGPGVITWTFYADGRVVSSDGRSWQVPPEDITILVDSIMALGFADFEASYIPKDTCCDRATHTITIYQDGEMYQVSVLDSAEAPPELYQVIDLIGEFLIALPTT